MQNLLTKSLAVAVLVLAVACTDRDGADLTSPVASEGTTANVANGTSIGAAVTVTSSHSQTFSWTIEKSASPAAWNLFRGDDATSQYTINVVKDTGVVSASMDGEVCVTNSGALATTGLAIKRKVEDHAHGQTKPVLDTSVVDVSSNPVLDPSEKGCYKFKFGVPNGHVHVAGTYKHTVDVTITNHAQGQQVVTKGPSTSNDAVLPTATPAHGAVSVNDSNGQSFPFTASGSVSYLTTYGCDKAGTNVNTAQITYTDDQTTGPSDDATVTVNCFSLGVSKTASTKLKRTYSWGITKSVDQPSLTLSTGQSQVVNYTVTVSNTGSADSDWNVSGGITVTNPAPIAAKVSGVADQLAGFGAITVNCGTPFPLTIAANSSINCTYSSALPAAISGTNTATATLQNHHYGSGEPTTAGSTPFQGTAQVDFGTAAVTHIDASVSVEDTYLGSTVSGTVTRANAPRVFNYTREIGAYLACGVFSTDNTASYTTADNHLTGSASARVTATVPCAIGCTLTQGYWKNHSKQGKARYDDGWKEIGVAEENTIFYKSGATWLTVFRTPPKGNSYYTLAHQYMAAVLNKSNKASVTPAVTAALASAHTLFTNYAPTAVNKVIGQQFTALVGVLDSYNSGTTGPGHCSE